MEKAKAAMEAVATTAAVEAIAATATAATEVVAATSFGPVFTDGNPMLKFGTIKKEKPSILAN